MIFTPSNHALYQLAKGNIDLSADTIKCILMSTAFTFDRDTHATYADVSASELATKNGYTVGGVAVANQALAENDTDNVGRFTCDPIVFTATAADDANGIGPFQQALFYDDTTADDTILFCADLESAYTLNEGSTMTLSNIKVDIGS